MVLLNNFNPYFNLINTHLFKKHTSDKNAYLKVLEEAWDVCFSRWPVEEWAFFKLNFEQEMKRNTQFFQSAIFKDIPLKNDWVLVVEIC